MLLSETKKSKIVQKQEVKDSGRKRIHTKQPLQRQQAGSTAVDSANGVAPDYNQVRSIFFIGPKGTPLPNQWRL